jgi:LETM1 and EF-hand domain-containing protein 1
MRLAVAKFMQETLQEIADKKTKEGSSSAQEILEFVDKARNGEPISNEKVVQIASQFKDELTLPNISRPQLISMCKYMGLQTLGSDDFLRFQLRTKFRNIKEDDRRILWEGIDSLNTIELREACKSFPF